MRPDLAALIRDSVADPRDAARRLLALRLPLGTALEAVVLVSALGAILVAALGGGVVVLPGLDGGVVALGPLVYALILVVSILVAAAALATAGRALGGRGTFDEALVVMAWMQVIAAIVSLAQIILFLLLPVAAPVVMAAGFAILLWCGVNFVRVLHGFAGWGRAAGTIGLALLGVAMALVVVAMLLLGTEGAAHV